jgi:hypothetical protein
MTSPQGSLERLEPRWAPARLTGGALPAQFGVDLSALADEMDSLTEALPELAVNDLFSGSVMWLRVPQFTDTPTWEGTIRDRLATAGAGEGDAGSVLDGDGEHAGGGTTSGGTIEIVGGSLYAGSLNWGTRADFSSGAVIKVGGGSLTLTGASLSYGAQLSVVTSVANLQTFEQITQTVDAQWLQRRDVILNPTSINGGTLLLGDGFSTLSSYSGALRLSGSSLSGVTITARSVSGSFVSSLSPELLVALTSAGVIAAAPAEAPVEQAPEVNSDPLVEITPTPIEPPVQSAE